MLCRDIRYTVIAGIDEASVLPHFFICSELVKHSFGNRCMVNSNVRRAVLNLCKRAAGLETDFEPVIEQGLGEAVKSPFRIGDRQHSRDAAADGKLLQRIQKGIGQLAGNGCSDFVQRRDGVIGYFVPGEQVDRV